MYPYYNVPAAFFFYQSGLQVSFSAPSSLFVLTDHFVFGGVPNILYKFFEEKL